MNEILDKIYNALTGFFKRKYVVFRFQIVDGTEKNKQIKIANSIEYEFVNSGDSKVILNNTLILYPFWSGILPTSFKGTCHANETDETVYEYRFEKFKAGDPVLGYIYTATTASNSLVKYDDSFSGIDKNRLQVIIKQLSPRQN